MDEMEGGRERGRDGRMDGGLVSLNVGLPSSSSTSAFIHDGQTN